MNKKVFFMFIVMSTCSFDWVRSLALNVSSEDISSKFQKSDLEQYLPEFYETRKKVRAKDIFNYLAAALGSVAAVIFSSSPKGKQAAITALIQTACEIGADAASHEDRKSKAKIIKDGEVKTKAIMVDNLNNLALKTLELLGDDFDISGTDLLLEYKTIKSSDEQYRFMINLEMDISRLKKFISQILYSLFWLLIK